MCDLGLREFCENNTVQKLKSQNVPVDLLLCSARESLPFLVPGEYM